MKQVNAHKKSILTGIGFLFFVAGAAQNAERITALLQQNNLLQAKEAVDSLVKNEAGAPAYWLQATVYNTLANDGNFKTITADAKAIAFNALQKATTADKLFTDARLKENSYRLSTDIYTGYTTDGLLFYNAGVERNDKASFAEALANFKKANTVGEFIYSNGWSHRWPDTLTLIQTAKSAIYADNETNAIIYCKKIIDNNYNTKSQLSASESIYKWLAYYYKTTNQEVLFTQYAAAGAAKFPGSVYFKLLQADWLRNQKKYPKLLAVYAGILKLQPQNQQYRLAYLTDVFNYLYQHSPVQTGITAYADTLKRGLTKLIAANPQLPEARLLLAKHYTNQANVLANESLLRSTTDAKIMNGYKTRQINTLQLANAQLTALRKGLSGKLKTTVYEEAGQLLQGNGVIIGWIRKNMRMM